MAGRKQYLDEYLRMPLEIKQDFAKKILAKVDTHAPKVDKQEIIKQMAQIMGLNADELDDTKLAAIQGLLGKVGQFMRLPLRELEHVSEILGSANARK